MPKNLDEIVCFQSEKRVLQKTAKGRSIAPHLVNSLARSLVGRNDCLETYCNLTAERKTVRGKCARKCEVK